MTAATTRQVWMSGQLARLRERLGLRGQIGVCLLVLATGWAMAGWRTHTQLLPLELPPPPPQITVPPTAAVLAKPPRVQLSPATELPLLLTQVQQIVVNQGLPWQAADYKLTAANAESPASMEIRCGLKGTYPAVRRVLTQLLADVPGLAIRTLSIERTSIDTAQVETKLTLVIFLDSNDDNRSSKP